MTELEEDTICLSKEQHAVYSCICYFDVFKHPVKPQEVVQFTSFKITQALVNIILDELVAYRLIFVQDGFYFLDHANTALINKRSNAEKRFYKKQKTICWFAGLISVFPFVESVSISGSCSKGLLDEDGDVDYFIITTPQRVWLCRTLLIAFKKIFLLNSKKYFCVNYFVDTNNMEIPDRNAFVATEIKTLMPLSNRLVFEKFLKQNDWTNAFFPNKPDYNSLLLHEPRPKKYALGWLEWLLNNRLGDAFDKWCFQLTLSAWEKKFPHFSRDEFDLNLRSKKNVSKHHPRGYQLKVLTEWSKKLERVKVLA